MSAKLLGGGGGGMCPQCPHGSYTYDTHMHVHPHTCQRPSALHGPGLLATLPQHPYMIIHCSAYVTELIVLSQQFFYAAHRVPRYYSACIDIMGLHGAMHTTVS